MLAREVAPNSVPEPLGHDPVVHALATRFLASRDHPVWKGKLLAGAVNVAFAP